MTQPVNPPVPAAAPTDAPDAHSDDPALQGEGNINAARRHRKSVEAFIAAGSVGPAAEAAVPVDAAEADALRNAEAEGRSHAKR